jgi:hypothetical protein
MGSYVLFFQIVTLMKTLELVQTAIIIVLAGVLGVHLATDVSHTAQNSLPQISINYVK